MVPLTRIRRLAREWAAGVLGLLALLVAVAVYWRESEPGTYRLRVTAGSVDGLRHQIALGLARAGRRQGVELEVVGTTGSDEALTRVDAGSVDLALVQGGLDPRERDRVRQVAAMKIEPLHLLVKEELAPAVDEAEGLDFLRGRRVNLSERGSGTFDLARDVLAFAGLRAATPGETPGDYVATTLGYTELVRQADRDQLPDAVFTVSALPSPVVKYLLTRQRFRLVPLRFGEAFTLDAFHAGARSPEASASLVERAHVFKTEIPAFTYAVAPPIPPQAVPTFGTRLLVVANAKVDANAIAQLLTAAYSSGPGGPVLDPALLEIAPELEWHPGTLLYRERTKPLFIGDAKSTSLFGALAGGCFFLWQWNRQRVRRRNEQGFESYMLAVTAIEQKALALELATELDARRLLSMQLELIHLKTEAVRRFADGEIADDELISAFIAHVNDARNYLTRLILHARENLENEAIRQRRPVEALWVEAVGDLAPRVVGTGEQADPGSRARDPG